MVEAHLLSEMSEKVNQSKRYQEIRHIFVPWVLKAAGILVQILHDNRFPPREVVESLLKIGKVINNVQVKVCSD